MAEHVDLGYAVTAHRAQGVTIDTAHVLVDPTTARENLYVAMTRGRKSNWAYVILDRPDDQVVAHPGDNPDATACSIFYGVLQHSGAELSAHETITAEQDRWGSIAQLVASAQHDRWTTLITTSGLTTDQSQAVIDSDAFGALTAELCRTAANHHNFDILLPRLIKARGFADVDDIVLVIHHLANATTRPAGSGHTRQAPRLITGLIPEATGPMAPDMRQALTERRRLIETRATYRDHYQISPTRTRSAPNWKPQRRRSTRLAPRPRYRCSLAPVLRTPKQGLDGGWGVRFNSKPNSLRLQVSGGSPEEVVDERQLELLGRLLPGES